MRYAQLNPVSLVMNVIDVTPAQAAQLTTQTIPIFDAPAPDPGSFWNGFSFDPPEKPVTPSLTELKIEVERMILNRKKLSDAIQDGSLVDRVAAATTKEEVQAIEAELF